MEAWHIRGEGNGGRSLPNSAAVVVRASDDSVSEGDVAKVTDVAKKASMMGIADLLSRTVIAPNEIPVGVVTTFVGAPLFVYLLRRGRKN
jgi:ABC-type enterochelin transport system permease subunit